MHFEAYVDWLNTVVGPMARSVKDAAMVLNAMVNFKDDSGHSPDYTARKSNHAIFSSLSDLLQAELSKSAFKGVRIGVARNLVALNADLIFGNVSQDMIDAFEGAIADLKTLGAEVIDNANIEVPGNLEEEIEYTMNSDFKPAIADYLGTLK